MGTSPTALATRPGGGGVTDTAREHWDSRQIALIGETVAKGATPAQLQLFLELAARYQLDPFAKEIWCAVPKNQNGTYNTDRVLIMVGRDGLLKVAQRNDDFRGLEGDVVREDDEFAVTYDGDARKVRHSYGAKRGAIVGAWAIVRREGKAPTYFYAPWDEYMPQNATSHSPWKNQKSSMILKCAESMALRKAYSISGLVTEEEMALANAAHDSSRALAAPDSPAMAYLFELFRAANEVRLGAFTPAKQRLIRSEVEGDAEKLEQKIAQLVEWVEGKGGVVPVRPIEVEVQEEDEGNGDTDGDTGEADIPPAASEPEAAEPADGTPEPPSADRTAETADRTAETADRTAEPAPAAKRDPVREAIERTEGTLRDRGALQPSLDDLGDPEGEG